MDGAVRAHAFFAGSGAPGVTAAVLTDQGSWMGAAGKDGDGRLLVPEAMMGIASISKTFTAAEVLHLAAAGRVDLDAPMSNYVEHRLTSNGATVRETLGMRSGIRFHEPDTMAMLGAVFAAPGSALDAARLAGVSEGTPSAPGGGPAYSDANYWLLGLLVENVTGRSLAQALRADLLDPAGLHRVAVQDAEQPTPPLGAPPSRLRLGPPDGYLPCRALATAGGAAGGMAADAPTLTRWGYQLYGARLLPAETVHTMMTQESAGTVFPERTVGYGLGTMLFLDVGTETTVGHSGQISGLQQHAGGHPGTTPLRRHPHTRRRARHLRRNGRPLSGHAVDALEPVPRRGRGRMSESGPRRTSESAALRARADVTSLKLAADKHASEHCHRMHSHRRRRLDGG